MYHCDDIGEHHDPRTTRYPTPSHSRGGAPA